VVILDELTTGLDPHARRDVWQLVEQIRADGVTVLLVTHFMEEAERLCDRLALIDRGRVVAVDSPAGMAARTGGGQRMRFRLIDANGAPYPFDDADLLALSAVNSVTRHGDRGAYLEVSGGEELIQQVTGLLARRQIIAAELRVEQTTLDDAFISLTGHAHDDEGTDRENDTAAETN
jgi:ABC-2 type transport system ATP-binding protein